MKLIGSKEEMVKVIGMAQSTVSNKSTLPVLGNILLNANEDGVFITATDLEIGLKIKADIKIVHPGSVTIPARKMGEIVRKCPDMVIELNVTDNSKIEIKCGKSKFNIMGIRAEDFPNLPSLQNKNSVAISDQALLRMIRKTSFSVSVEETRHILNGALFQLEGKKVRMVSTDGHRLSFIEKDFIGSTETEKLSAILPTKALNQMAQILEGSEDKVTLYFTDNQLFLEKGNTLLVSRLLDGQFPNYEQVIPKQNATFFRAACQDLIRAVERVSLMASARANSMRLSLKPNILTIYASTPDLGEAEEEIDVEYTGSEMALSFNAHYVLDALKAVDSEKVECKLATPLSPALILPLEENPDSKFVIMPMRI